MGGVITLGWLWFIKHQQEEKQDLWWEFAGAKWMECKQGNYNLKKTQTTTTKLVRGFFCSRCDVSRCFCRVPVLLSAKTKPNGICWNYRDVCFLRGVLVRLKNIQVTFFFAFHLSVRFWNWLIQFKEKKSVSSYCLQIPWESINACKP